MLLEDRAGGSGGAGGWGSVGRMELPDVVRTASGVSVLLTE